ncbi:homoserine dehydrogenase [Miniphocaeibacter halophilus]|uniref:Homoserine dehydrogenase n=1 Tax=Miniphocaeibacter halophilus TaxID=2931922 RepID=A0AC61MNZ8_9FIRM|nr:homoserine dehydrogenase [Miniphocaeibacter halophilus]QQK07206.1 homoserine dehydrogenase [Miniphocaeibacter halophilus]
MKNIAILGFGTVGQGVYEILLERREKIKEIINQDFYIKTILVNDINKERDIVDGITLTNDFNIILNDPEIDIVVELTGALEKGFEYISKSLKAGKNVVTANKSVVSAYFKELHSTALENKVKFLYEASVGGGIPIIKPLREEIMLNDIESLQGILNGTCNYILSRMFKEKLSYKDILKDAQELGYAEADPTDDVEGLDTMRKLRILSSIAFGVDIREENIDTFGISTIELCDVEYLEKNNSTIKLLATSTFDKNKGYTAFVEPTIVTNEDYFSTVSMAFNSISFEGSNVGPLKFYGAGAGKLPTGDAVCRDIIDIFLDNTSIEDFHLKESTSLNHEIKGSYYLRTDINEDLISDLKNTNNLEKNETVDNNSILILKNISKFNIIDLLKKYNIDEKEYFLAKIGY